MIHLASWSFPVLGTHDVKRKDIGCKLKVHDLPGIFFQGKEKNNNKRKEGRKNKTPREISRQI